MPRTTADPAKLKVAKKKLAPPRISPSGYKLPPPIPNGQILTDVTKAQWRLGKSIGVGGFGEIYLASRDLAFQVANDVEYVVKIEPFVNGPLFTEMHFYQRAAKAEMINDWKSKKKLAFLGMPVFHGSGSLEYNSDRYRFMVIPRFGPDLQRLLQDNGKMFSLKTVLTLGIRTLDILEYIHSTGYVHNDVKAANLLVGYTNQDEVYLVDFGLACKYVQEDGHKPYVEDRRKAHNGTLEFTSRDAHAGAGSRRSDLEILCYNLVYWLCGTLPWAFNKDVDAVYELKKKACENIPHFLKESFGTAKYPGVLETLLQYVVRLGYEVTPDYTYCKRTLVDGIRSAGLVNDGKLYFGKAVISPVKIRNGRRRAMDTNLDDGSEVENNGGLAPLAKAKKNTSGLREPCAPAQTNRIRKATRSRSTTPRRNTSLKNLGTPDAAIHQEPPSEVKNKRGRKAKSIQSPPVVSAETKQQQLVSEFFPHIDNPTPAMLELMAKLRLKKMLDGAAENGDETSKGPAKSSPATKSRAKSPARSDRDVVVQPVISNDKKRGGRLPASMTGDKNGVRHTRSSTCTTPSV